MSRNLLYLTKHIQSCLCKFKRYSPVSAANYSSTKPSEADEELDRPVKYSTSRASTYKARESFGDKIDSEQPFWHVAVISGSMAVFFIYFFILREENDIDELFDKSLYDHVENLEEIQLRIVLKHDQEKGLNTDAIEKRLAEVEGIRLAKEKNKAVASL